MISIESVAWALDKSGSDSQAEPRQGPGLVEACLEAPRSGALIDGHALRIQGWVVGKCEPAVAVELVHDEAVLRRAPVSEEHSGFALELPLACDTTVELTVRAVLRSQERVVLGRVQARRGAIERGRVSAPCPLVSIVIPCYNQAHFLDQAIESALAQTHPKVEVVVVDDGASDNTAPIAARYPGVRYVRQANQGLAAARNTGLRQSRGSFLIFLDADDRLLPQAVEAGLDSLAEHPECAFTFGQHDLISFSGAPFPNKPRMRVADDHYCRLLQGSFIANPAMVLYRRSALERAGGFDTALSPCADYDIYLRIARRFPITCHDTVVAEYRHHGTNMSLSAGPMLRAAMLALRKHCKHVRGDERLREAYRRGVASWQSWYGPRLLETIRCHLRERRWKNALADLLTLAAYYPQGLSQLAWICCSRAFSRLGSVLRRIVAPGGSAPAREVLPLPSSDAPARKAA
jgi:glycosyltransferase involved in cell wall biosynthesis